jgi:6-pyruvoyltetrahydropterin/6-carboxytetrahydropterin synthase
MSSEVGASMPLRALHRLPSGTGAEREPHAHDYRIEVVVEREQLDGRGVVCDLDILRGGLEQLLGRLEGRDVDQIRPPDADGVTVEILAHWLHESVSEVVRDAGGETLVIRVWEAPDAFGGYRAPSPDGAENLFVGGEAARCACIPGEALDCALACVAA